ncbi:MAG: hypothetical protein GC178_04075 [Flavobacteriales bacterium]|nr:hypothetical protein [Flavobacteriales bacterium]
MSNSIAARIWEAIEPRLNRRSVAFMLCLLLSALFWLLTSLSKEYVDEVQIPIHYNGIPEDVLVVNEPTQFVTAEVKGFGFDLLWNWLKIESLDLSIDASPSDLPTITRQGAELHYFLTNSKDGKTIDAGDDQVQIISVRPDTVFLQFKPKYLKQVPVKLDATFSFQKQYGIVSEPVLVPDSVLVIGPREMVDTINAVYTEPQTFSGLDESVTTEAKLRKFGDNENLSLSHSAVQVEVNVVEFTEGTVTVPLNVITDMKASVQVFPQEVELRYLVPLPDFDKVEPSQFQASVVLDNETKDNSRLVVYVEEQPINVRQVRADPPQVEFIIQK